MKRTDKDKMEQKNFPRCNIRCLRSKGKINFSIESDKTKSYDILKMTGQQTNQEHNDGSEDNN